MYQHKKCLCSAKVLQDCTQDLLLQFFHGSNSLDISFLENMKRLDRIHISDCATLRELNFNWNNSKITISQKPLDPDPGICRAHALKGGYQLSHLKYW